MNLRPLKCTPQPALASALAIRSTSAHCAETFQRYRRLFSKEKTQVKHETASGCIFGNILSGNM